MRKLILLFLLTSFGIHMYAQDEYYFKETFNDIEKWQSEWIRVDAAGTGFLWDAMNLGVDDAYGVASPSFDPETGDDISPNNWLISPVIDLTDVEDDIILSYFVGSPDEDYYNETYRIRYKIEEAPSDTAYIEDFVIDNQIGGETLLEWNDSYYQQRILDISGLKGKKIRLAFIHTISALYGSQSYLFLDNITIEKASEMADLSMQAISLPTNSYAYPLGYDIPVSFSVVNKGLETALNVKATYVAAGGYTFTEDLPDIEAGKSYTHTFSKWIPAYDKIIDGEKIKVTVSASNENILSNNSLEKSYYVFPYDLIKIWDFDDDEQNKDFWSNAKILNLDNHLLDASLTGYFPNNLAWNGIGTPNDEELQEYWGKNFMSSASTFRENGLQADRWLILPKIYLKGTQFMLEWYTALYSSIGVTVDEEYEVLISDTGNEPEDFVSLGVFSERSSPFSPSYRRLNLSDYAEKEVYIAFRNITQHNIVLFPALLWLDNIMVWSDVAPDNIKEEKPVELRTYPNPVNDILYIEGENNIQSVSIVNYMGQHVYMESGISSTSTQINMSHLPASIYILNIQTEDKNTITKKIIKK